MSFAVDEQLAQLITSLLTYNNFFIVATFLKEKKDLPKKILSLHWLLKKIIL